ncbi:MAG: transcription elongation factor GreA [Treponemataceae bacterium]
MSEKLLKSVQEMLNEEKWTRAAISNYTKNNFIELATKVDEAKNSSCVDEVKAICDEHLSHTKNSIIALYISGMLGLKKKNLDNSAIVDLLSIFIDNKKNSIVEYLCESILAEDETNKFALRTLAECYKEDGNEKIFKVYEEIVRLDIEEADIAKNLAEHYEEIENFELSVEYYKKALHRFISKKAINQIKEVWTKLVEKIPEEIDFFKLVQNKIAKTISEEKSVSLMQDLYKYYKENKIWDTAIDILKLILKIDEKDNWARKELVECFKEKYENHSQLQECINISNLESSYRNVFESISDFEKHIAFDKGNFVFHRSWGVGKIGQVTNDKIRVNFGKKYGVKSMTLKMAVDALKPLAKDHIWVLKATTSKAELVNMVKTDIPGTLKIIIKSFDNNCDFKRIKLELVPSILTTSEWTSWSTKARKAIETNSTFGVNPNDISMYTVRSKEVSKEEKLDNEFKAQKNFFSRIDIFMRFMNSADTESDLFTDMFNYFVGYLKAFSNVNEQIIASFLVVRSVTTKIPHLSQPMPFTFAQLFEEIENPQEMYRELKDSVNTSLRKDFLKCIRDLLPNWNEIYIKLFPTVLQQDMIDQLIEEGYKEDVKKLAAHAFENYKDYREAVVFFFKESREDEWFKEIGISEEKQYITLIHIIDLTYKEIDNHCNTTENRKINKQIQNLLFKNDTVLNYILENDKETITRIFSLIDDMADMDHAIKIKMQNKILEKYPDFKFYGAEEKTVASKGVMVTQKMFALKQDMLQNLVSVEIPANSKEIGEAMEKGDLRENAEYKAARERQTQLSNQVSKLQDEIARAQIFNPDTITTSRVSFGTVASLKNTETGETEEYTILGPWESDPNNNIISYMSPFGNAILNSKEKETLEFTINERKFSYIVTSIKPAKF